MADAASHRESTLTADFTAAQLRVVDAAVRLFAVHGVGGTSLQMIADAIGVTKAAVYHQFRTKDEIVHAACRQNLTQLDAVLVAAEAVDASDEKLDVLLTGLVDLAVANRQLIGVMQNDPVIIRLVTEEEPYRQVIDRLHRSLAGDDPQGEMAVPAAMLSVAIGGAVIQPAMLELDDETLRRRLLDTARRFVQAQDR